MGKGKSSVCGIRNVETRFLTVTVWEVLGGGDEGFWFVRG
jgi:hypothetical protein